MNAPHSIIRWTVVALAVAPLTQRVLAQQADPVKITEHDTKAFNDMVNQQKTKARQTLAIMNARQIGLALFEFETEFAAFPNDETAGLVKALSTSPAEVKAVTANDCFFQLIAANFVQTDGIFSLDEPEVPERAEKPKPLDKLVKCSFAYLSGLKASGHPGRPVVVAPLVRGKTTFDPQVLGGKAVVLMVDNSVISLPIEPDGRVLIDGKDIFDSTQPFWGGKVPPVKWPE